VSIEDVQRVFVECGIYRIVLDADASQDYEFVSSLVDMFGPRRIVVTIVLPADAESGEHGGSVRIDDALQSAERCRQSGVQRVIVRDAGASSDGRPPQLEALYSFADRTKLSITADTGVRGYRDLRNLQDLHPAKIDSIILHDALYSNSFPCQKIWRLAEKELIARHRLL
jgi:phosphoribosylformimino-5-aminoimidazole carboxamide ribonucleotide (ProFAR) isomerase